MKKRNRLGVIALSAVLGFSAVAATSFALTSCATTQNVKSLEVEDIEGVTLGQVLDFNKLAKAVGENESETIKISVEILTPETLALSTEAEATVNVIKVGDCKLKVIAGNKYKELSFKAYAVTNEITVIPLPADALVNNTYNLDEYVTLQTQPLGQEADYKATVITTETAQLDATGKVLTLIKAGEVNVKVEALGNSSIVGYLRGNAKTESQVKIEKIFEGLSNNYKAVPILNNGSVNPNYAFYHTENYNLLPQAFFEQGNYTYSGFVKFPQSGNAYEFDCGMSDTDLSPTVDTVEFGALTPNYSNYYMNMAIDNTQIANFGVSEDDDTILVADCTMSANDSTTVAFLITPLGVTFTGVTDYTIQLSLQNVSGLGNDLLCVEAYTGNQLMLNYLLIDIGTTTSPALDAFMADPSNEPDPINTTTVQTAVTKAKDNNLTIAYESYLGDRNTGEPVKVTDLPTQMFDGVPINELLKLYYSSGTTRYTENGYITEKTSYIFDQTTQTSLRHDNELIGAINKDNLAYGVNFDGEAPALGDKLVVSGADATSYAEYYPTMAGIDMTAWNQFIFTLENKGNYTFTIDGTSAAGARNIYLLVGAANYTIANRGFAPKQSGETGDESASYGDGTFGSITDTGFTFEYHINTMWAEGISYQITMKYTVSNMGTTAISEYNAL